MKRIILTEVTGYGWLPTIEEDGKETYRGEFRGTPAEALSRAEIEIALKASAVHPLFAELCNGMLAAQRLAS